MKDAIRGLVAGDIPYLLAGLEQLPSDPLLLSGSFNPLHHGHIRLLNAAREVTGRYGLLELSVTNVDKPPLELEEIRRRLDRLKKHYGVVLTRAPTFAEKAALLPGAWFAMGLDTVVRLLDAKYHADRTAMFRRFAEQDTRFVVAGRLFNGEYLTLEHVDLPRGFEHLFIPIQESTFREDISSTELRRPPGP